MTMTSVFAEITKTAPQDDGTLFVYGKATGSDIDLDQQRCDPEWLKRAMPDWFSGPNGYGGNIREQHDSKRAIGKATDHEVKEDGHYIRAHIVDPVAVAKTKAGVFSGFSIGISKPRLEKTGGQEWIKDGSICEISLVDRPALPTATLTVCKAAKPGMTLKASDFDPDRMLVRVEELVEKTTDVDHLDAPAPGQKCADCGADGHLKCADVPDMQVTLGDRLSPEQAAVLAGKVDLEPASPSQAFAEVGKKLDDGANYADAVKEAVLNLLPEQTDFALSPTGSGAAVYTENFDRDDAVALVTKAVANADAGLGEDESPDINGALEAITIIAGLIQREAQALGTMPAQGCDIDLLMQAVHALRIFNCREAKEQAGIDPGCDPMLLAADADVTKDSKEPYGNVSYADPGYQSDKKKRYPLDSKAHARSAWDYINKSENADKYSAEQLKSIKSRIKSACKKFGVEVDADSQKAADVDDITNVDEAQKAATAALEVAESAPEDVEVVKAVDTPEEVAPVEIEKTDTPEISKAAVVEVTELDEAALVKAVSAALEKVFSTDELEKAENPIRKALGDIVSAANESTVKSVNALTERLETVEQMATPGGPALRRTEIENAQSRRNDLTAEVMRYKALATHSEDQILRKGYAQKAAQLEAQIRAV